MLNNLKTRGDKFTDPDFLPGPSSLIEDWNDKSKEIREITDEWKEFKWIRASQIPSFATGDKNDTLQVFKDRIEPSDIEQGRLSDGYMLSALAAISEKPSRVRKLFVTDKLHQPGIFAVIVYKNGEKQQVLVDDYFPCRV